MTTTFVSEDDTTDADDVEILMLVTEEHADELGVAALLTEVSAATKLELEALDKEVEMVASWVDVRVAV